MSKDLEPLRSTMLERLTSFRRIRCNIVSVMKNVYFFREIDDDFAIESIVEVLDEKMSQ